MNKLICLVLSFNFSILHAADASKTFDSCDELVVVKREKRRAVVNVDYHRVRGNSCYVEVKHTNDCSKKTRVTKVKKEKAPERAYQKPAKKKIKPCVEKPACKEEKAEPKIATGKKKKNLTCHYCRISAKRKRSDGITYVPCSSAQCKMSFCTFCLKKHFGVKNTYLKKCVNCAEVCCCHFETCTKKHKHCFTYRRTQKRHAEKPILKWTKKKKKAQDEHEVKDESSASEIVDDKSEIKSEDAEDSSQSDNDTDESEEQEQHGKKRKREDYDDAPVLFERVAKLPKVLKTDDKEFISSIKKTDLSSGIDHSECVGVQDFLQRARSYRPQ